VSGGWLREERSPPVLNKIKALLPGNFHPAATSALLGKPRPYAQWKWPKLQLFVPSGNDPIDNTTCENSIRPSVRFVVALSRCRVAVGTEVTPRPPYASGKPILNG